ncbi:MAG TPA: hypothetical protein VIJ00_11090 [Nakamurella sp.]
MAADPSGEATRSRRTTRHPQAELPGGGRVLFPTDRLVALYGHPGMPGLGALGEQDVQAGIARAADLAAQYQPLSDRPVVPTFDIIASYADTSPGPDGNYSEESPVDSLRPWVEAAGRAGMYVVLDLQPGRTDFLTQAQTYRDLLTLPYVGLGLDPEWRIGPSQVPGDQIGAVDAAEVNTVITWLADLTTTADLPQKLLVIHQFDPATLRDENTLDVSHPQVAVLLQMDGQGTPDVKDRAWQAVTTAAPPGVRYGWMNLGQDTPMLTPAQTMSKQPTPWMITHQ